ncbi:tetratricopeptide repeat protein [Achromobacter arsenitoxydans]|uniref:Tetratricopeptide repeat family protein 10 n=1 Tax=Achromobacter arsenitoxydans SY8 TaxID=477184 RepID=H0FBR3_9BURK|nr:tetratricopeptide repeat protein [Achromobacter arsenitoxydans]EHK64330.1 tetratricopeptide repeat family protein 10 [Achromobacter arsenitoxydans SY8]
MTIKPRFRVALLALALAGAPLGVSVAQSMSGGGGANPNASRTTLDPIPPEGGWDSLAKLLEAAKPSLDTRLEPSASQITTHIERLLNNGKNEEALAMIEKRQADIKDQRGTDVQLMFQHARALAALDRTGEAIDVYTEMTTRFPELPEPWNNLAALYASRGELERAQDALQMALRADPGYAAARANLGDLQLMQALRTYKKAAGDGVPGMQEKVREVETMLKEKQGK